MFDHLMLPAWFCRLSYQISNSS